jgi:hypothetical protein
MSDGTVDQVAQIHNADLEGGPDLKEHYALEGNKVDDYYAAGQEYRSYANETDKPVWSDEEKKILGIDQASVKEEAKVEEEKKVEEAASTPPSSTTPTTPKAPAAPAAPSK